MNHISIDNKKNCCFGNIATKHLKEMSVSVQTIEYHLNNVKLADVKPVFKREDTFS